MQLSGQSNRQRISESDTMKFSLGKQIVVIDNGFVHVGECSVQDGYLKIDNCKNIRVWGTTKGLGELISGPTSTTTADLCGTVLVPQHRIVFFLKVIGGW